MVTIDDVPYELCRYSREQVHEHFGLAAIRRRLGTTEPADRP